MKLMLILGNQLFSIEHLLKKNMVPSETVVYMREDTELCTHFRYHKHKLIFFLTAMRDYADELRQAGFKVHYEHLVSKSRSYDEALKKFIKSAKVECLQFFEIEDKFFETRIQNIFAQTGLPVSVFKSPMFVTTRQQFKDYLLDSKKPFMKSFYEQQRKHFKIMVDDKLQPLGGRWSFDDDNRKSLPRTLTPPELPEPSVSPHLKDVQTLVDSEFNAHPGNSNQFWLPTSRAGARLWFDDFLQKRFRDFGPYEDAMPTHSAFVFHSVLSPFLNVGLLEPAEVIRRAIQYAKKYDYPVNSTEGFIRQVVGWREFVRGIYQNFSEQQDEGNFWKHQKQLTPHWYNGTTGIAPLDDVIKKTIRYGYAHHIERLMVVGSLMQLLEIQPQAAHRWFMEMFIDSSDWVMGPNTYGMALFSDGGIFATKPYICGSNYYKKMGPYKTGDWQDGVDGLYWNFIEQHKEIFKKNRSSMILAALEKIPIERKQRLAKAAKVLRQKLTC